MKNVLSCSSDQASNKSCSVSTLEQCKASISSSNSLLASRISSLRALIWSSILFAGLFLTRFFRLQASNSAILDLPPMRTMSSKSKKASRPCRNSSRAWFLYVSTRMGPGGVGSMLSSSWARRSPTKVLPQPGGPWMMASRWVRAWATAACWLASRPDVASMAPMSNSLTEALVFALNDRSWQDTFTTFDSGVRYWGSTLSGLQNTISSFSGKFFISKF